MYLAITNGTTNIILNDDTYSASAGLYGARYFPLGGTREETVTETIEQVFSGTVSDLRTTVASLRQLLSEARERYAGNLRIPAVYLIHNPVGTYAGSWRSEIIGGDVGWSPSRDMRQMHATDTIGELG